jgi:hypothetical protein
MMTCKCIIDGWNGLFCSYGNLWVAPIVLVGYSFGGLVVKSLIVEVHRRIHQNSKNPLEQKVNESCKNFSKYLKGIVFYGVPHSGGPQKLLEYIVSKCQEKNVLFEKRTAQSSLLKNLESFNRQMRELSVDFESSISTDLITFGFGEGKPLDEKWVSFKCNHLHCSTILTVHCLLLTNFVCTNQFFCSDGNCIQNFCLVYCMTFMILLVRKYIGSNVEAKKTAILGFP